MSAQTPQTDRLEASIEATGKRDVPVRVYQTMRGMEADRDHYKALCEELREALKYARRFMKADSDLDFVDAALKKASAI
jgi:hypothetical protein